MIPFAQLLEAIDARPVRGGEVGVTGVQHDSRAVVPGDVFVAIAGAHDDGARFVADAAARGAVAVVAAHEIATPLPLAVVPDPRAALGPLAAAAAGDPTAALTVVGITGTNGKTTSSYLTEAALHGAGKATAVVGTLGARIGDERISLGHTTPEADDLQALARRALDAGATHLVMEVSSHALELERVRACKFAVAVFTNLTQDHLDFHGTMERYAAAKRRLFVEHTPAAAVINIDDPFGRTLAADCRGRVLTVSSSVGARADVSPLEATFSDEGLSAMLVTPSGRVEVGSPLIGRHNLDNALSALGVAVALGLDPLAAATGIAGLRVVPGRLERVDDPSGRLVLVDYAHTPDALRRALAAVRPLVRGRLVCVFGCGGDRDRDKRPRMGEAVRRDADWAIVTSDNPRSEPPAAIIEDILPGLVGALRLDARGLLGRPGPGHYVVEPDRRAAIELAIRATATGDCVLVAGKGHEDYQIVGSARSRFSDQEEARRVLG
jgi:UDP-N-acetylmuramoyl-L-alanyl-D-glutamate--2,6-diaminopimelate ligase